MPKNKTVETGKKNSVKEAFEEMSKVWSETEAATSTFGEVEDGTYQCKIDTATINCSKASGRLQCSWQMEISNGDNEGKKIFKHDGLDSEQAISYFKAGLARLGVDVPEDICDLGEVVDDLRGTSCEVRVKTKDDYQNVYFQKALDDEVSNDEEEEASDSDAEEAEEEPKSKKKVKKEEEENEEEESEEEEKPEETEEEENEEEESEEEEKPEETEEEENEEEALEVVISKKLLKTKCSNLQLKQIKNMAKKLKFDEKSYSNPVELLADMLQDLGVSGEFETIDSMLEAANS